MVLFHPIVEVLDLADDDLRAMLCVVAPDGGRIGLAPINGDLLWHAVAADGFGQEPLGGLLITVLRPTESQWSDRVCLGHDTGSPTALSP